MRKLKLLREKSGKTQKEVAAYIQKCRSTYTLYETGDIQPPYDVVLKLKKFFNYQDDDILSEVEIK